MNDQRSVFDKKLDMLAPWAMPAAFAGTPLALARGFFVPALGLSMLLVAMYFYFRRVGELRLFKVQLTGAVVTALIESSVAMAFGRDSGILVVTGLAWLSIVVFYTFGLMSRRMKSKG